MVVSAGAVRMSVPIVPAQTIKQVTLVSYCPNWKFCASGVIQWAVFPAGGTQALNLRSTGGDHHSDPAAAHHACDSAAADPAQLHQPASRHRAGSGPWRRERGLRGGAGTIRHTGQWRLSGLLFTPSYAEPFLLSCSCSSRRS